MTKPALDITTIIPAKWKTWVTLIGAGLAVVIPFVLTVSDSLPQPWPAVIGGVVALLTTLGVYHAPYAPAGTTLAVDPATPVAATTDSAPVALPAPDVVIDSVPTKASTDGSSPYHNPWK